METPCPESMRSALDVRIPTDRSLPRLYESRGMLPTARELHLALCTHFHAERLGDRARALRDAYHRLRLDPDDVDSFACQRAQLIREMVDYLTKRLEPVDHEKSPRAQAFAEIIDCMAAAADRAFHLLETVGAADPRTHGVWTQLARLELGYSDLVGQISGGYHALSPGL